MEIALGIFFAVSVAFIIWVAIMLEIDRAKRWKEIEQAPPYIIRPSYGLGYEIQKKELWPLPGGNAPMMSYLPLLNHYSSLEEAEKQLSHYNQSKGESND